MTTDALTLVLSLVVLAAAGDQFVIGLGRLASVMRVRPSIVGAIIGGLAASLTDLTVAGVASFRGARQLATGCLVGSIVDNVCLALAIAALIAPIRVDSQTLRREAPISVGAVLLFAVFLVGGLSRTEGALLAAALLLALVGLVANARRSAAGDELTVEARRFFRAGKGRMPLGEIVRTLAGLLLMLGGSGLFVKAASSLSEELGVAEGFVGLTLVAVGTSAPLIVIAIQAARRGNHDLVVGNMLGANLFIALAGGAIVASVGGEESASVSGVAVCLMALVVVASWGFMARRTLVTRWEAAILIATLAVVLPFIPR